MADEITPALTPAEWAARCVRYAAGEAEVRVQGDALAVANGRGLTVDGGPVAAAAVFRDGLAAAMALANAALLDGDPHKLTRDMRDACVGATLVGDFPKGPDVIAWEREHLTKLAAALSALLPPEPA